MKNDPYPFVISHEMDGRTSDSDEEMLSIGRSLSFIKASSLTTDLEKRSDNYRFFVCVNKNAKVLRDAWLKGFLRETERK